MHEEQSQAARQPIVAFVLSLVAGIWMLMPGVLRYTWSPPIQGGWRHHGMIRDVAPMFWWPGFGVVAGIIVLIGAEETLQEATRASARYHGQLRQVHLRAHLARQGLLSAQQTQHYATLRGYTSETQHQHRHNH